MCIRDSCNTDNTVLGTLHSEYIVHTLGITSGNFVILKGDARQITDVPQIYAGMMTEIQPYVDSGDIKIVLEQNCTDWKAEEAMKHAESALTLTNNEVDVFVCMNDGIASGVIAVLEQKGLAGKVIVTGMDSEGAALRLSLIHIFIKRMSMKEGYLFRGKNKDLWVQGMRKKLGFLLFIRN